MPSPSSGGKIKTVVSDSGGRIAVHRSGPQPAVPSTNSGGKFQAQPSGLSPAVNPKPSQTGFAPAYRSGTHDSVSGNVSTRKKIITEELEAKRKQMGLDQVKLSASIEGLDKTARRAEKLEQREEEKRKAGGNLVEKAILVDDTGRRWGRLVTLGIVGILALGALVYYGMHWSANRTVEDPKVAQRETRERLSRYAKLYTPLVAPYDEDETATTENFKARLESRIKKLREDTRKSVTTLENAGKPILPAIKEDLQRLGKDLAFVDGHGHPIVFSVTNDTTVEIKSSAEGAKPVNATIPRHKPEPKKK